MPATDILREKTAQYSERVAPVAASAGQAARESAQQAGQTARVAAQTARQAAHDYAAEAREWATPLVEVAVERVRDDVIPKVAGAVTAAMLASEPVRDEAKARGAAAMAALKGETVVPASKKKHRVRKFLLLLALSGGGVAVWRALNPRRDDDLWSAPLPGDTGATSGTGWTSAGTSAGTSASTAEQAGTSTPDTLTDRATEAVADATQEARERAGDAAEMLSHPVKEEGQG